MSTETTRIPQEAVDRILQEVSEKSVRTFLADGIKSLEVQKLNAQASDLFAALMTKYDEITDKDDMFAADLIPCTLMLLQRFHQNKTDALMKQLEVQDRRLMLLALLQHMDTLNIFAEYVNLKVPATPNPLLQKVGLEPVISSLTKEALKARENLVESFSENKQMHLF